MAVPYKKDTVFHVETRAEAIDVLANGGDVAIHDHNTNPLIHHAASELIVRDDRGLKTDIRAIGLPHQVLQQVAGELQELGISAFSSHHIMDALQSYAVGLGADFAREAQAKPLYARVVVTDRKPDDMPDCELVQATMIDGERRLGEGVSQRVMQSTIYGTRTSMTKEMNLDEMFASSQKKWLLIYYGSPSSETYKGIEAADVALINVSQGLGGYLKPEQLEALEAIITSGEASPTLQNIINDFVEIERAKEQVIGQDVIPVTVQAELIKKIEKISTALQTISQQDVVGEAFKPVIHDVLTQVARDYSLPVQPVLSPSLPQAIMVGQASNDDAFAVPVASSINPESAVAIIEQMKVIAKRLSESKVALSPADAEMQKSIQLVLAQIEGKSQIEAAKLIQTSMNSPISAVNSAVVQNIQSVVANLVAPQALSPQVQEMARQFSVKNPSVVEVVATKAVIQQIESRLRGDVQPVNAPVSAQLVTQLQLTNPAELKQVLQVLKAEGIAGLVKADAQSPLAQNIPASARAVIEQFVKQNPAVVDAVSTAQLVRQIESQIVSKADGRTNIVLKSDSSFQNLSPTELKQVLQIVKSDGIAGLVRMDAQSPLVQNIPASARAAIEQFVKQNPAVVEAASTALLVRQIESQIVLKADGRVPDGPLKLSQSLEKLEPAELKQILEVIKSDGYTAVQKQEFLRNFSPDKQEAIQSFVQEVVQPNQASNAQEAKKSEVQKTFESGRLAEPQQTLRDVPAGEVSLDPLKIVEVQQGKDNPVNSSLENIDIHTKDGTLDDAERKPLTSPPSGELEAKEKPKDNGGAGFRETPRLEPLPRHNPLPHENPSFEPERKPSVGEPKISPESKVDPMPVENKPDSWSEWIFERRKTLANGLKNIFHRCVGGPDCPFCSKDFKKSATFALGSTREDDPNPPSRIITNKKDLEVSLF